MHVESDSLKPCRWCDATDAYVQEDGLGYFVRCPHCDWESEYFDTRREAVDAWNDMWFKAQPKPFNPNELRPWKED